MSLTDPPALRDKLLQILADIYPGELRFSELYEKAGSPSRSVFSEALSWLEKQKLVARTEISYKYVTYRLNEEEYLDQLKKREEDLKALKDKLKKKSDVK